MRNIVFALLVCAGPASATCPASPDISDELDTLIAQARAAPNDVAGQAISKEMWKLWLRAPDDVAQEALDKGMRARSSFDFLGAVKAYTTLVSYCPDYAEGYNQRAYISFLSEDYAAALVDLDKALILSPNHVGAQSGRALTLMKIGRLDEARDQLLAALENNPWLSERFLLTKGGPLAPTGEEL